MQIALYQHLAHRRCFVQLNGIHAWPWTMDNMKILSLCI